MAYEDIIAAAIHYWDAQEASGALVDAPGVDDLSAVGTPVYQQAGPVSWLRYSVDIDGSNNFSAANPAGRTTIPFTIAGWTLWDDGGSFGSEHSTVIARRVDASLWEYQVGYTPGASPKPYLLTTNGLSEATTTPSMSVDTWHFFAVQTDGVNVYLYLDGTLQTVVEARTITNQTCNLRLGRHDGSSNIWNGNLAGIGVWDSVLSEADLDELFAGPVFVETQASSSSGGVTTHRIGSKHQRSYNSPLRVLEPDSPAALPHRIVLLLPVKPQLSTEFGDGLAEAQLLDLHNTHNATCVAPDFGLEPWIGDHPTNTGLTYESFIVDGLVPWIRANIHSADPILICSFSKGGYSALTLLLKYPELFRGAAAFDTPCTMLFGDHDSDDIYGTQTNFDNNYDLDALTPSWVSSAGVYFTAKNRIWLGVDNLVGFNDDMQDYMAILDNEGVLYSTIDYSPLGHHWTSGWLSDAFDAMDNMVGQVAPLSPFGAGILSRMGRPSNVVQAPIASSSLVGVVPSATKSIAAATGSLTVSGVVPSSTSAAQVAPATLSIAGVTPTVTKLATAPIGSITVAAVDVGTVKLHAAPVGSLTLTGVPPSTPGGTLSDVGTITISGVEPTVTKVVQAPIGVLTISAVVPGMAETVVAAQATILGVTPSTTKSTSCPIGTLILTPTVPSVPGATQVDPGLLSISAILPTVVKSHQLEAGVVSLLAIAPEILKSAVCPVANLTISAIVARFADDVDLEVDDFALTELAVSDQSLTTVSVGDG